MKTFGQKVRARRLAIGKSRKQVALEAGISVAMIGRIERDEARLSRAVAVKIAESLSLSLRAVSIWAWVGRRP